MATLTDRQKLTIKHLEDKGITESKDIVIWADKKLQQPGKAQRSRRHHPTAGTRKHSKEYYWTIRDYYGKF